MERIKRFFEEARVEFRHVNWPTRTEAMQMTGVVILISLFLAFVLGGVDVLFSRGLAAFIAHVVGA
jgi:preprotein translocase SecE subunit